MLILLKLIIGHFLCDFPLQGPFLSQAKSRKSPVPGVPFLWALVAHAAIQGGMVWLVTGSIWCGYIEFALHGAIDWLKCEEVFTFSEDQWLHIACKVGYAVGLAVVH